MSLEAEKSTTSAATTHRLRFTLPLRAALAAARGRGGGCGRIWSSGHARAVAETAVCRLGSRRSRRRPRLQLCRWPKAGSQAIGEVRSLSVVRVCISGSDGRVWSCGRSSSVLVVWNGSPASGWLVFSIFPGKEKISDGASFVSGCQSGVLFVCLLACVLCQVSPRSSCSAVFVVFALARARLAIGVACTHTSGWLVTRASRGARCAVFVLCCGGVF